MGPTSGSHFPPSLGSCSSLCPPNVFPKPIFLIFHPAFPGELHQGLLTFLLWCRLYQENQVQGWSLSPLSWWLSVCECWLSCPPDHRFSIRIILPPWDFWYNLGTHFWLAQLGGAPGIQWVKAKEAVKCPTVPKACPTKKGRCDPKCQQCLMLINLP